MILPIYNGKLIKKEERWFVISKKNNKEIYKVFFGKPKDDIQLEVFPNEQLTIDYLEKQLEKNVDYTIGKKLLANETVWYAKIVETPKEETWDLIIEKYKKNLPPGDLPGPMFIQWIKREYNPPIKKH